MNTPAAAHAPCAPDRVAWLFLDLNSFFASCEQQDHPEWRGRPLIVVPAQGVDTTCAIAASYEAKRLGIKTGTPVWEARQKCPELIMVGGGHRRYVEYHNKIIEAIESCLHVDHILSIDECACKLMGDEQIVENAIALARKVKATIAEKVGECLTSSIGLAPNRFMGKVASNMQKPNGLTVLTPADLPHKILHLKPRDLPGIGPRMEKRLDHYSIFTMADLYEADIHTLHKIYNGVEGERLYQKLRGIEPWRPPTLPRVISHEHVLEPELRNQQGLHDYIHYLLAKSAERLRGKGMMCKRMVLSIKWHHGARYFTRDHREVTFHATNDTLALIRTLNEQILPKLPAYTPFRIGIALTDFTSSSAVQGDLFAPATNQRSNQKLSPALDALNAKYGRGTVYFGGVRRELHKYTSRIAFSRVPQLSEYEDPDKKKN